MGVREAAQVAVEVPVCRGAVRCCLPLRPRTRQADHHHELALRIGGTTTAWCRCSCWKAGKQAEDTDAKGSQ